MLRGIKQLGKGITYVGLGGVFVMLVVGTVAIDLVLLAYLAKQTRNMHANQGSSFLTGMLWGMMFSRGSGRGFYGDVGISLLLSPITTGIAIVLSFCLGVPFVAVGLGLAWAGVAAVVGLGLAIYAVADAIDQRMNRPHYGALYHGVDIPALVPTEDYDQLLPQQQPTTVFITAQQPTFFAQPTNIHHHPAAFDPVEPTAPAYFEQNNTTVQVNVVNVLPSAPPPAYAPTMFGLPSAPAPVNDADGFEPPPAYEEKSTGNGIK